MYLDPQKQDWIICYNIMTGEDEDVINFTHWAAFNSRATALAAGKNNLRAATPLQDKFLHTKDSDVLREKKSARKESAKHASHTIPIQSACYFAFFRGRLFLLCWCNKIDFANGNN